MRDWSTHNQIKDVIYLVKLLLVLSLDPLRVPEIFNRDKDEKWINFSQDDIEVSCLTFLFGA